MNLNERVTAAIEKDRRESHCFKHEAPTGQEILVAKKYARGAVCMAPRMVEEAFRSRMAFRVSSMQKPVREAISYVLWHWNSVSPDANVRQLSTQIYQDLIRDDGA